MDRGIHLVFPYLNLKELKENKIMDEQLNDIILEGISAHVANLQLPDPYLRDYYRDEVQRIYWISGPVDESTLDLTKFIIKCNKEDADKPIEERKRILIMIDSPGGSVEVEQSVIGAIKISKTPVYTCCYCTAYSAAADILACGHQRFALPFTNIMFHAGSGRYEGTQAQIDSAKKFFDRINKRVNDEVFSRVNFEPKMIKKLKTDDVYMSEEEALKYGVIDKIIENFEELM
jgi:ATP-dependent Clp protease protease subunit